MDESRMGWEIENALRNERNAERRRRSVWALITVFIVIPGVVALVGYLSYL